MLFVFLLIVVIVVIRVIVGTVLIVCACVGCIVIDRVIAVIRSCSSYWCYC